MTLASRARDAAAEAVEKFVEEVPEATKREGSSGPPAQVEISKGSWQRLQSHLEELFRALVGGWERKSLPRGLRSFANKKQRGKKRQVEGQASDGSWTA